MRALVKFQCVILRDRLMAGRQPLELSIMVRIHVPQLSKQITVKCQVHCRWEPPRISTLRVIPSHFPSFSTRLAITLSPDSFLSSTTSLIFFDEVACKIHHVA